MRIDHDRLRTDFTNLKKTDFDVEKEAAHVEQLIGREEIQKLVEPYEYVTTLRAGGSGIVMQVRDVRAGAERAMKLSRSSIHSSIEQDPEDPVKIDLEVKAMSMVSHGNITHLYAAEVTHDDHYCFISQLVTGAMQFDEYVDHLLETTKDHDSDIALSTLSRQLADALLQVSHALSYMHEELQLYHMDLKPANLLMDKSGRAFVTDLGFARCGARYSPNEQVPIGFTFGFHHPDLARIGSGKFRAPSTLAKARNRLEGRQLGPKFDLYSFGRSVLCLLRRIERRYGEGACSNYHFSFLHLLATLMLDNVNQQSATEDPEKDEFLQEFALSVRHSLLTKSLVRSFHAVSERLERLLDRNSPRAIAPELDQWSSKGINHGAGFLSLTPRVDSIINHPALQRLRRVKQLGVADDVYPGATHSRFAHVIGVTAIIIEYINSLIQDRDNPLFAVLYDSVDVKSAIVAGLVHDVGQAGFGHELEELDEEIFAHDKVTRSIIQCPGISDFQGRSLQSVLEGARYDEWGIEWGSVADILSSKGEYRFAALFGDMLNGVIDADKVDYLRRDGVNCNLPYSLGIDVLRFLKCVTAIPVSASRTNVVVRLGIKQKGLAAAESISWARRQMYQAAYLQHTTRCCKALLLSACWRGLGDLRKSIEDIAGEASLYEEVSARSIVRSMYVATLFGLADWKVGMAALSGKRKERCDAVYKRVSKGAAECLLRYQSLDAAVGFLYGCMDDLARGAVRDACRRPVYKRLAEKALSEFSDDGREKVRKSLQWNARQTALKNLCEDLLRKADKGLQNRSGVRDSLGELPGVIQAAASEGLLVVADVPMRSLGPGGSAPPVWKDIERKRGGDGYADVGVGAHGHIWRDGMDKMMREITMCRIYCEPRFYDLIKATVSQEEIEKSVRECVGGWAQ